MNDIRFPGLANLLSAAPRSDSLRGAQDASGHEAPFDRSLQRSLSDGRERDAAHARTAQGRAPTDDNRRLQQSREADRRAQRAPADAASRREINRPMSSTESRSGTAQDARKPAAGPASTTADTPQADAAGAPSGSEVRSDAQSADAAAAATDSASAAQSTSADASATALMPAAATAPLAQAIAVGAQIDAAGNDGSADVSSAGPAADDGALLPGAAQAAGTASAARRTAAAAAEDVAAANPAKDPRKTLPELSADLTRTPAKDRLLEDFERRFENSLARAVGVSGGSPLNPHGPLAAAGLPSQLGAPSPALPIAHAHVATPLGHAAFGEDLSQRVLLLAGQRISSAEISVTPNDLGPISVSIEVRGQEAAMQFAAGHATTRAAIEDALPRLREMLAAQGLQLTQADVGDRSPRDAQGGSGNGQGGSGSSGQGTGGGNAPRGPADVGSSAAPVARRLGLIDIRV